MPETNPTTQLANGIIDLALKEKAADDHTNITDALLIAYHALNGSKNLKELLTGNLFNRNLP